MNSALEHTEHTAPPYAVRPHQDDPHIDAFDIIGTTGHIIGLGPVVLAVVGEYEDGQLLPHVATEIRTKLKADADFIVHACNTYEAAIKTLEQIANYGDLNNGNLQNHPLRHSMSQLSGQDCAELARTTLHSITPPPTNDEQQEPEIESDEPASYRVEIDRCPLYLSIEAKSGTSAIQKAIDLVRLVTKNETEGLRLPLGEPGDHDADAIIYPSFDAKDYGIADIEPMV